jgi:hypothetical protein
MRLSLDMHNSGKSGRWFSFGASPGEIAKNQLVDSSAEKLLSRSALNSVTALWTPRTRLKIRVLQMHVFD